MTRRTLKVDKLTLGAVHACVRALYKDDPVPNNVMELVSKECHRGFNAFTLDSGTLTLYFCDGGSLDLVRGFDCTLTDEEIHLLATEGMKNPPAFDPDNVIYYAKMTK